MFYTVCAFAVTIIVAVDQISKYLISSYLKVGESIEIIPEFFSLYYVRNTGASFSMLEGKQFFFYIITIAAVIGFSYLLYKCDRKNKLEIMCLIFIIAGAIGNFIDRVMYQYVIDFLSFTFWGHPFAVFNVADCFITVGVALYLLITLKGEKHA